MLSVKHTQIKIQASGAYDQMQIDSGKASYVRAYCGISALLIHNSLVGPDVDFLCFFCKSGVGCGVSKQQKQESRDTR